MRQTIKILNGFGIMPTNNYVSAGSDFYIPYFDESKKDIVNEAFKKSYGVTDYDIVNVLNAIKFYGLNKYSTEVMTSKNIYNIAHLFFALQAVPIESYEGNIDKQIELFVERYLVFDNNGRPGITLDLNDYLLINSGIHIALQPGTAGIFFNKSGKGNAGFDVRAQVVDEDYTGYVHLSLSYTKDTDNEKKRTVYCGDKITQMIVLPVINCDWEEVDAYTYFHIMEDSKRGSNSFGSSDEAH